MTDHKIYIGDCLKSIRQMPDQSVHCCITSPPYFGLRNYGHAGQIGLEETPQEFVARLVEVFAEVHRVLRNDGTLWLNIGDSYWSAKGSPTKPDPKQPARRGWKRPQDGPAPDGIKQKELIGIPWRPAFALQDAGWYLRQDIIWHKPNPMPESVKDRCTKAHEYVFLLTKRPKYYFDADAIREPCSEDMQRRARAGHTRGAGGRADKSRQDANSLRGDHARAIDVSRGRNKRDVWSINVASGKKHGAHFAVFPEALVEPCLLAGCPESGTVLDPFGGSGTVGVVAKKHGRDFVLCELNPAYAELARDRIGR